MTQPLVLIAGGGIGGLATALTLHQIGVRCVVFEAVQNLKPLGVGINLQPNAVRELFALSIGRDQLDKVGLPVREWALVGRNGHDIYSEPRGESAGYKWPQYAVHRGKLHMLLYNTLIARAGAQSVRLGARVTGYQNDTNTVTATMQSASGQITKETGTLLIGADGIHSAIRAQMHPNQPPINWGGKLMWRGTSRARPIRSGSSFVGLGTHDHRLVVYPISHPDPDTGLADINWIAEVTLDNSEGWQNSGWFKPVPVTDFSAHFQDWTYDWLDVPALLSGAEIAYENPMIDRDPIPTWCDQRVALMGDAAHAMYPTGSNGASQALIDARILGASLITNGVGPKALDNYQDRLCGPVSDLILRNRGDGPFGLLNLVHERCGGAFDDINQVISQQERAQFMAGYKSAAGFAMETLNAAPQTIAKDAQIPTGQ